MILFKPTRENPIFDDLNKYWSEEKTDLFLDELNQLRTEGYEFIQFGDSWWYFDTVDRKEKHQGINVVITDKDQKTYEFLSGIKIKIINLDDIADETTEDPSETIDQMAKKENFSIRHLQNLLKKAVEDERYEDACDLRDRIATLKWQEEQEKKYNKKQEPPKP